VVCSGSSPKSCISLSRGETVESFAPFFQSFSHPDFVLRGTRGAQSKKDSSSTNPGLISTYSEGLQVIRLTRIVSQLVTAGLSLTQANIHAKHAALASL